MSHNEWERLLILYRQYQAGEVSNCQYRREKTVLWRRINRNLGVQLQGRTRLDLRKLPKQIT